MATAMATEESSARWLAARLLCHGCDRPRVHVTRPAESLKQDRHAPATGLLRFARNATGEFRLGSGGAPLPYSPRFAGP
jgi:hypothetical protein